MNIQRRIHERSSTIDAFCKFSHGIASRLGRARGSGCTDFSLYLRGVYAVLRLTGKTSNEVDSGLGSPVRGGRVLVHVLHDPRLRRSWSWSCHNSHAVRSTRRWSGDRVLSYSTAVSYGSVVCGRVPCFHVRIIKKNHALCHAEVCTVQCCLLVAELSLVRLSLAPQ